MTHDFSIVFDTESEYWQRVLAIFAANESYPKKRTKGRELHHKFPRSFSKKLGEDIDNTEENLISLSLADHFRVHYYYYLLANKGYRQPMALAFQLMVRSASKHIGPATMEEMALDYEELRRESIVAKSDGLKKWYENNPEAVKMKNKHISESHIGDKNPMFRRFLWKDEDGKFKNINLPDDIKDEELEEYRFLLHFFTVKDWRERLKKLEEICLLMEMINDDGQ